VLYQLGPQGFRDAVRLAWAGARGRYGGAQWKALLGLPDRWQPPRFPISGDDLIARGIRPGPGLGQTLGALEDWWAASGFPDDKDAVLKRLAALRASE
jgi:hypothetical protein